MAFNRSINYWSFWPFIMLFLFLLNYTLSIYCLNFLPCLVSLFVFSPNFLVLTLIQLCNPECTNSLACFLCNIVLAYYLKIRNIFESFSLFWGATSTEEICVLWIPLSYEFVVMKPLSRKILLNCFFNWSISIIYYLFIKY